MPWRYIVTDYLKDLNQIFLNEKTIGVLNLYNPIFYFGAK